MGTLAVMTSSPALRERLKTDYPAFAIEGGPGDTKLMWSPDNQDEVNAAKKTFDELRKKRFLAFKVEEGGKQGEQVTTFDPKAGKIIMVPQFAGG